MGTVIDDLAWEFEEYLESQDYSTGRTKHPQSYSAFLRAASLGIDPRVAIRKVVKRIEAHGGLLIPYQVERQLQRAYEYVRREQVPGVKGSTSILPKPAFSPEVLKRIAANVHVPDIVDFVKAHSALEPVLVTSDVFLDRLYYPGETVLVFDVYRSQGQAVYEIGRRGSQALPQGGPEGVWFLSNPVDGQWYPNPREKNKLSRRSEESITAWRYMVIESDQADFHDWLAAVVQMPLKIVAIYSSGGKSIHCLVRLDAETKAAWDEKKNAMKSALVALGADPGALTAVRLTRLPQTWRGTRRQELLYLNPAADGTPIVQLPPRAQKPPPPSPSPL